MRLLLDTHALLWWFVGDERLSQAAKRAISRSSDTFVSAASAWEIAIKHRAGKLPGASAIVGDMSAAVVDEEFRELPISLNHGQIAGSLPDIHRDPFDRMLMAQAMAENLVLVSNERLFDAYGVARLW
ncbi:MAG TPA: type II toxin-antitoxin system VapC family toxin [Roseiarcus sp.]|nr:type II toxin-antitoxin system VapC family toxin [Roseiarcus sp.]